MSGFTCFLNFTNIFIINHVMTKNVRQNRVSRKSVKMAKSHIFVLSIILYNIHLLLIGVNFQTTITSDLHQTVLLLSVYSTTVG